MVAALSSAALGGITVTVLAAPAGHSVSSSAVLADGGDGTGPSNPAPTPAPTDTHSNPDTWGWG